MGGLLFLSRIPENENDHPDGVKDDQQPQGYSSFIKLLVALAVDVILHGVIFLKAPLPVEAHLRVWNAGMVRPLPEKLHAITTFAHNIPHMLCIDIIAEMRAAEIRAGLFGGGGEEGALAGAVQVDEIKLAGTTVGEAGDKDDPGAVR